MQYAILSFLHSKIVAISIIKPRSNAAQHVRAWLRLCAIRWIKKPVHLMVRNVRNDENVLRHALLEDDQSKSLMTLVRQKWQRTSKNNYMYYTRQHSKTMKICLKQRSSIESSAMTKNKPRYQVRVHIDKNILNCARMRKRPQWRETAKPQTFGVRPKWQ